MYVNTDNSVYVQVKMQTADQTGTRLEIHRSLLAQEVKNR